jgi:transcriptional regulator with XRE-family HTH domain
MSADNTANVSRTLGLKIRKLREASGKTQHELAENAGLSTKHLGEVERGRGNPSLRNLLRLAAALGTAPGALFDFEQEEKTDEELREEIQTRLRAAKAETVRLIHRALRP